MSHDLEIVDGRASFAYNGKRGNPWHMLGTDVDGDMPIHVMMEASGADYTVRLEPLFVSVQHGVDDDGLPIFGTIEVPDHWATVRSGGRQPEDMALGVVKSRYAIQQNRDLAEVAQAIVGLGGGDAVWDTMGVIRDGRVFFAYLRLPSLRIDPQGINDRINQGLVVTTSHDGSMANTIGFSSVRVVCQNTLSMALGGLTQKISVKHTASAEERIKTAAAGLSMYATANERLAEAAVKMLQVDGSKALNLVLAKHFPKADTDAAQAVQTKRDNVRGAVVDLYLHGPHNKAVVGDNGWGVYNAAVEYLDWEANVRGTTDRFERIATSVTLDQTKRDIANTILALA